MRLGRHLAAAALLAACAAPVAGALPEAPEDGDIRIESLDVRLSDGVLHLDTDIRYVFSAAALEALHNGVALPIQLKMEFYRERSWWLDDDVATLRQRYRIHHEPLGDRYRVVNVNTGQTVTLATLADAIDAVSHIRNLPLLDVQLLPADAANHMRLRVKLEIEELPLPLRPIAWLLPRWHHTSEWVDTALP